MPDTVPKGFVRREIFVDAKDLQSEQEDGTVLSPEEYIQLLQTRGSEKLAEHQIVRSFSATVRTLNPTYEYGKDFFLGDTVTAIDERLGISADAVVQGVERSVSEDGETMTLILGYEQPTIYEKLQRKAAK